MRRQHLFLFSILFLFLLPYQVEGEESAERVIVTFKNQIETTILEKYAMEVHYQFENLSAVSITITSSQKDELLKENKILRVDPDSVIKTNGQLIDWGYSKVQADRSKESGWTGKGVKVGIIDTGISTAHPDLKVAGGISFVEGQPSYNDDEGHGTHVAGIVAALDNSFGSVGVAPDAEIYAIKALNSAGEGNQSDVVAGIQWAIENKMDIVNLSITSPEGSYLLNEAIQKAYNQGMILIAASGNSLNPIPQDADVLFPSRYPAVISVGSVNQQSEKSSFSYFGSSLDFVAPGEKVLSTYSGIVEGAYREYAYMTGTSMAAPYVTGIAALYKQAYPFMSNQGIRQLLQESAIDLGEIGKDNYYGYGLIQAPEWKEEPAVSFPDIDNGIWFNEEISFLYNRSIITGYPDGKFYPNHPVTRAEAITMISKALKKNGDLRESSFSDVTSEYYASGYIQNAVDGQIITGYPNNTFKPKAPIIRGDVAVMLQKAFGYELGVNRAFNDVREEKYYFTAVNALKSENITTGYPDGTFKPTLNITRAEFAVLLARALEESFK